MCARDVLLMSLALLTLNAWADQTAYPAKAEAASQRPVATSAEEKAKATAVQQPAAPARVDAKASAEAVKVDTAKAAAEAARVSPGTSSIKTLSPASAEVQRLVRSGQVEAGRTVAEDYQRSGAPATERADVSLTYGNELLRATRASKGTQWYGEAKQQFRGVIAEGAPEQQLVARNNLAAIDFAEGNSEAALKTLDEGYSAAKTSADPSVKSQYFFNYAQAVEKVSGPQSRDAAALYREAFIADPRRREAADAGMTAALAQGKVGRAADFVDLLVEKGHLELAEKRVREALDSEKVRQNPDAYLMVSSLMSLIGAQKLSSPDYRKRWETYVRDLGPGLDDRANKMRTFLQLGYGPAERLDGLLQGAPRYESSYYVKQKLGIANLPDPQAARVSTYFWQTGRVRAAGGESVAALSLYSLAWLVNQQNINAATAKANLLLERRPEIDADGKRLDRFVDELFLGKGEAYLGSDWRGILRFHTVLGTIYWKQRQWGTSGNPRGAIFQLEHAVSARKQIQGPEADEPIPGLYTMLADCYVATNRLPQAYDAYQRAAREALNAQNTELAADIVTDKLPRIAGYEPTPKQRDIGVTLEKDIRAQREGA